MGPSLAAVALVLGVVGVLGAPAQAVPPDDGPVAAEQVAGLTLGRDGVIDIVVVDCADPFKVVPGEQLGVWEETGSNRVVRWAIEGEASDVVLPDVVRFGRAPTGFRTLAPPRELRDEGTYRLVLDGHPDQAEGIVFRLADLDERWLWEGSRSVDRAELAMTCKVAPRSTDPPTDDAGAGEGTALAIFLLILVVIGGVFVGGLVLLIGLNDRMEVLPTDQRRHRSP